MRREIKLKRHAGGRSRVKVESVAHSHGVMMGSKIVDQNKRFQVNTYHCKNEHANKKKRNIRDRHEKDMKYNAVHKNIIGVDLALKDLVRLCDDLDMFAKDPLDAS